MAGERRWFALSRVFLGLTRRDGGATDANAWKDFGFDLDDRVTSKDDSKFSRFSCKRAADTASNALADGNDGIDNNFGSIVLAVLESISPGPEKAANNSIAAGEFTLLLRVDGVVDGDNASAPGALYAAGPIGERWPVWSTALVDGVDLEKPVRQFPSGYISGGTWVSGATDEPAAPLWIPLYAGLVDINASATVTLDMRSSRGVFAGATTTSELTRATEGLIAKFGGCRGVDVHSTVDSLSSKSADLVMGAPSLQDESRTCDAVSFGIGFDAQRTQAPTKVVPGQPPAAPLPECASDAGATD